jgi:hypothetical protein
MIIMTSPAIINITIIRTRVTSASPFRLAHPWQGLVRAVPNSSAVQLCRDTRWLKRSLHPDHVTNMFPVRLGGATIIRRAAASIPDMTLYMSLIEVRTWRDGLLTMEGTRARNSYAESGRLRDGA